MLVFPIPVYRVNQKSSIPVYRVRQKSYYYLLNLISSYPPTNLVGTFIKKRCSDTIRPFPFFYREKIPGFIVFLFLVFLVLS
jgi:hypothetical protein